MRMTLFLVTIILSCIAGTVTEYKLKYDLSGPAKILELPPILNEISGLTDIDNNYIACTQDELGIIFIVNIHTGEIKNQYEFEQFGDFEGLTHVEGSFFVLRSDGRITLIPDYRKPDEQVHIKENLPTKNNEGLCYDKDNDRLLIAAKSKPVKGTNYGSSDRLFYAFNLKNTTLDTTPVFTLKIDDIIEAAVKNKVTLPVLKGKKINFRPSSLAIHPVSKYIYIISAADYLLVVCDTDGRVITVDQLNPELYQKAEGITFLPDNTMIITNEAKDKKPTMMIFNYQSF